MTIQLLPFHHNWGSGLTEEIEYLTGVLTSSNLKEQRSGKRSKPRFALSASLALGKADLYSFQAKLATSVTRQYEMPYWPRKSKVMAVTGPFSDITLADALSYKIGPGTKVLITSPSGEVATALITLVLSHLTIRIDSLPSFPLVPGCSVVPLFLGFIGPVAEGSNQTAGYASFGIRGLSVVSSAQDITTEELRPNPWLVHDSGLEVLTPRPNWASDQGVLSGVVSPLADFGFGPYIGRPDSTSPYYEFTHTFMANSRDEINQWHAFMDRVRGRQYPFITPSWRQQFELLEPPVGAAYQFLIKGVDWASVPDLKHMPFLIVVKADGTLSIHEIDSLAIVGTDTAVYSPQAWMGPGLVTESKMHCWGHRVRLSSDLLTMQYITDSLATIELSMTSVEV